MKALHKLAAQRRVYDRLDFWSLEEWQAHVVWTPHSAVLAISNVHGPEQLEADPHVPIAWLRWFSIMDGASASAAARATTAHLAETLAERGFRELWCITRRTDWFHDLLPECQFTLVDRLITLQHSGQSPPHATALTQHTLLREMRDDDFTQVAAVDCAAFMSSLHYGEAWLRRMHRWSDSFVVAEIEGVVVGYQLTMRYPLHRHMVRLAVHPHAQGRGIGCALLLRELTGAREQRISALSLNVVSSNTRAMQLYRQLGFQVVDTATFIWRKEIS
ncbi:MAG: GNAT family N-acetyltransferase [Thermoflexales bacterium]